MKIAKSGLHTALMSNSTGPHHVRLWFSRQTRNTSTLWSATTTPTVNQQPTCSTSLGIVTWNCRGLSNSVPYLKHLFNSGSSIVVLQEHWLWPFELGKLQSVSDSISYHAVSDPRLSEVSELDRGCGGVAILWKKELPVVRIPCSGNGRICCAKVQLVRGTYLTIIGVYLPSDGYNEKYKSCLTDLEELLSSLNPSQPAMIVGDFNAHLTDRRRNIAPNAQGVALGHLINKHGLYVASLEKATSGPGYTYCSGNTKTTVDYILVNQCASYLITSSEVFDDHPLNTSDHLPLHTSLEVTPAQSMVDTPKISQVNWSKVDNNSISQYQNAINGLIRPLIGNTYDDIGEVEWEMKLVSMGICKHALQLLPTCKKHSSKTRFKDAELQR